MDKVAIKNIGFEVLEDTGTEIVLKRVLKRYPNKKSRYNEEMALPKLSVSYFGDHDLQQLQKIAIEVTENIVKNRKQKNSIFCKVIAAIRKKR